MFMNNLLTYLMTAPGNRVGITRIWKTLEGKNVKTNDGKDLGVIKKISEEYLLLQKGIVHKEEFWIPKYIPDAFDGKILWLILSEEDTIMYIIYMHNRGFPFAISITNRSRPESRTGTARM